MPRHKVVTKYVNDLTGCDSDIRNGKVDVIMNPLPSLQIADIKGYQFKGFIAWLMWLFLHVMFLIGFRNRIAVMIDWFWAYLTRERSARLITGDAEDLNDAMEFMQAQPEIAAAAVPGPSKDKRVSSPHVSKGSG